MLLISSQLHSFMGELGHGLCLPIPARCTTYTKKQALSPASSFLLTPSFWSCRAIMPLAIGIVAQDRAIGPSQLWYGAEHFTALTRLQILSLVHDVRKWCRPARRADLCGRLPHLRVTFVEILSLLSIISRSHCLPWNRPLPWVTIREMDTLRKEQGTQG